MQAVVSGWWTLIDGVNIPNVLHEVSIHTMSNSDCTGTSTYYSTSQITARMLCAAEPGQDVCTGDAGGDPDEQAHSLS